MTNVSRNLQPKIQLECTEKVVSVYITGSRFQPAAKPMGIFYSVSVYLITISDLDTSLLGASREDTKL